MQQGKLPLQGLFFCDPLGIKPPILWPLMARQTVKNDFFYEIGAAVSVRLYRPYTAYPASSKVLLERKFLHTQAVVFYNNLSQQMSMP